MLGGHWDALRITGRYWGCHWEVLVGHWHIGMPLGDTGRLLGHTGVQCRALRDSRELESDAGTYWWLV